MYDFWETIGLIFGFMGLLALFVGFFALLIGGTAMVGERYTCKDRARLYNTEMYFSWVSGCYLNKDDKFIPRDAFDKLLIPNTQYGNAEFNVNIKKD